MNNQSHLDILVTIIGIFCTYDRKKILIRKYGEICHHDRIKVEFGQFIDQMSLDIVILKSILNQG